MARELCGVAYYASSRAASGFGGSLPEGGSLSEVVREDRPQVGDDHRTGGNAKEGDDGRDSGKVLEQQAAMEMLGEGKVGSGGGEAEEAEAAAGGKAAEQVEKA